MFTFLSFRYFFVPLPSKTSPSGEPNFWQKNAHHLGLVSSYDNIDFQVRGSREKSGYLRQDAPLPTMHFQNLVQRYKIWTIYPNNGCTFQRFDTFFLINGTFYGIK
jgi:hypothetical protein